MENYFDTQREYIFAHVEVLIYVIEVRTVQGTPVLPRNQRPHPAAANKASEVAHDLRCFKMTAQNIKQFSPRARLFCLIHKMDLLKSSGRDVVLSEYAQELNRLSDGLAFHYFGTSIWDESLYRAWSQIATSLLPNVRLLEEKLQRFCHILGADEVVLFERSTFLVIGSATARGKDTSMDPQRFEKVSNLSKQLKLMCMKSQANFTSFVVRVPSFLAIMERFTLSTYLFAVVSNAKCIVPTASILCNIDYARQEFERLAETMSLGTRL